MQVEQVTDIAHAVIGGSTIERTWYCPGWIELANTVSLVAPPSKYAIEGTIAHAVAATALERGTNGEERIGGVMAFDEVKIPITSEMIDALQIYLDVIRNYVSEYNLQPWQVHIEKTVQIPNDKTPHDLFGTADAIIEIPYTKLVILDLKYGAGTIVEAFGNMQLMFYALGALMAMPESKRREFPMVEMVIVQPRAPGSKVSKFALPTSAILDEFYPGLLQAVERVKPGAPLKAHQKWCKFCPAKAVCPEYRKAPFSTLPETAQEAFKKFLTPGSVELAVKKLTGREPELPSPEAFTPEQIGQLLRKFPDILDWIDTYKKHAEGLIKSGITVPGWELEETLGHRQWADKELAEKILSGELGDDAYSRSLHSPTQMEKVIKKKGASINLTPYIQRPITGVKLVSTAQSETVSDQVNYDNRSI